MRKADDQLECYETVAFPCRDCGSGSLSRMPPCLAHPGSPPRKCRDNTLLLPIHLYSGLLTPFNMRFRWLNALLLLLAFTAANAREWRSSDGTRTFQGQIIEYLPPSVTVVKPDGQRITFNENLLSQADRRYCALANRVLEHSYAKIPFTVFQVLSYGILCQELNDQNPYFSDETMFIWGDFKDTVAENEAFRSNIYWAGSYSYTTVDGNERTIRSFALSLDEAVAIWEYRLSPPQEDRGNERTVENRGSKDKPRTETMASSGTGFAITDTGYIVTNAHVIAGARKTTILIHDQAVPAKVVVTDEQNDLAILKVEVETHALPIGLTDVVGLGDPIMVGGYPNPDIQGISIKLTRGVISGMKGIQDDIRHFQIDAAVQPGNSGGPLLNANGTVVGIVNARLNDSAVALATGTIPQNVNYAIKVDYLVPLIRNVSGLMDNISTKASPRASGQGLGTLFESSTYLILSEITPP